MARRWTRDVLSNKGLQTEAQTRIHDGIGKIIANVEKQGGVVSPYLKNILPKAIGAKLIRKIQANPALQDQMLSLQRLPATDASRHRRLAAIDRAVQQYLPEVAREELREAGVQLANASRSETCEGRRPDIDSTKKTEPKGSTGPAGSGSAVMKLRRRLRPRAGGMAKSRSGQAFLRQGGEGTDSPSRSSADDISVSGSRRSPYIRNTISCPTLSAQRPQLSSCSSRP